MALIVKVVLCIFASHKDEKWQGPLIDHVSSITLNLIKFNQQLTTIFTIFFILIIATSVRRLALFKAERGATVAELEQYQASISLPSTFRAIWSLRAFTFTSLALVFVWSWYYAGSQAAQREYAYHDSHSFRDYPIAFLGPDAISPFEDGTYANYSVVKRTDMTAQFHIYSQKTKYGLFTDGSDLFGSPLTPVFTPGIELDDEGWLDVEQVSTHPVATSIGNTIYVNRSPNVTEEFDNRWEMLNMIGEYIYPTAYLQADCSRPFLSKRQAPNGTLYPLSMALNMTALNGAIEESTVRQFDVWNRYNSSHAFQATCNISEANVEVSVVCASTGCKPDKVRARPGYDFPSWRTPFDNDSFSSSFFHAILLACGVPFNVDDLSTFEQDNGLEYMRQALVDISAGTYAADPSMTEATYLETVNFSANLSQSLTRYFNTFYAASTNLKYAHVFADQEVAAGGKLTIARTNNDFTIAGMHGAQHWPNYALSLPWVIVDLVSCAVLLFAALASFWLRKHTLAPDIFGYVSSLTRDNPHLDLPGGSTLSGIDRARRMKHVKVKIGDVGSGEDGAGRVGLTYVGGGVEHPRQLEKGRYYV